MRLSGGRYGAFIVGGAAGIAVAFSFFAECRLSSDRVPISRSLQASFLGEDVQAKVCQAKSTVGAAAKGGGEAEGELQLTATKDVPLKFKCGADLSLKPENEGLVFRATGSRNCESSSEGIKLGDELMGATLTKDGNTPISRNKESQVYVFNYSEEPTEEKHLCYTCVSTTAADSDPNTEDSQNLQHGKAAKEEVKCTVYITVPKKKEDPTSSSTAAPGSPSGAHSMRAALGTVVGVFLAQIPRL